jgi:hypothetical protein
MRHEAWLRQIAEAAGRRRLAGSGRLFDPVHGPNHPSVLG